MNFLRIFGFSGDPGSSPSIFFSLILLTSIGNKEKNTIHHNITYITIDPVKLNLNPYQINTSKWFFTSNFFRNFST